MRRSRRLLRDALIALIQEKGFDAVKIHEITDRATLNRATFYLHYQDKNDLLIKSMFELLEEMEGSILDPAMLTEKINVDTTLKPLIASFEHFADHAEFYRVMLCEVGVPSVINEMQHYAETVGLRWISLLQPNETQSVVDTGLLIKFISSAYIGVVKWWIENGMQNSSEHIAEQFMTLVSLGIFQAVGLEVPQTILKPER